MSEYPDQLIPYAPWDKLDTRQKAAALIFSNGGVGMSLDDLIAALVAIRSEHGGWLRVVCAPHSYSAAQPKPRTWWQRAWQPDPIRKTRTPEPNVWGLPGYGRVGANNPGREVTL